MRCVIEKIANPDKGSIIIRSHWREKKFSWMSLDAKNIESWDIMLKRMRQDAKIVAYSKYIFIIWNVSLTKVSMNRQEMYNSDSLVSNTIFILPTWLDKDDSSKSCLEDRENR